MKNVKEMSLSPPLMPGITGVIVASPPLYFRNLNSHWGCLLSWWSILLVLIGLRNT